MRRRPDDVCARERGNTNARVACRARCALRVEMLTE